MAKVLDALKKSLDKVLLFVEVSVKSMFCLEGRFVQDTDDRSLLTEIITNSLARICFVDKNFFTIKVDANK